MEPSWPVDVQRWSSALPRISVGQPIFCGRCNSTNPRFAPSQVLWNRLGPSMCNGHWSVGEFLSGPPRPVDFWCFVFTNQRHVWDTRKIWLLLVRGISSLAREIKTLVKLYSKGKCYLHPQIDESSQTCVKADLYVHGMYKLLECYLIILLYRYRCVRVH